MLDRIFDTDNGFFRAVTTFGYIWWLHVLWLICSLPILTIGASTTALCYSCMKLRKKEGYVTANFIHSFKENFWQSTAIFLIFLITGGIILFNLMAGNFIEIPLYSAIKNIMLILLVPYGITLLYVFAIQAKFCNSIVNTIKYAFWLALRNPIDTICMVLIVALVVGLNMTIVLANFVTVSMGGGMVAYILSAYYGRIFDRILLNPEEKECQ